MSQSYETFLIGELQQLGELVGLKGELSIDFGTKNIKDKIIELMNKNENFDNFLTLYYKNAFEKSNDNFNEAVDLFNQMTEMYDNAKLDADWNHADLNNLINYLKGLGLDMTTIKTIMRKN